MEEKKEFVIPVEWTGVLTECFADEGYGMSPSLKVMRCEIHGGDVYFSMLFDSPDGKTATNTPIITTCCQEFVAKILTRCNEIVAERGLVPKDVQQ